MFPFLAFLGDKKERHMSEIVAYVRNQFHLSDAEKNQMIPSGQFTVIDSRIGWARTYLKKAELIEPTARATYRITVSGFEELQKWQKTSQKISRSDLMKFPQFCEWLKSFGGNVQKTEQIPSEPPSELVERGYQIMFSDLQQDLLAKIKTCSPNFFEKLVVDLLLAMGYGGSLNEVREIAGKAVGKSGDGGIDGIIKEDRLGLDLIYIQAKRWKDAVGSNEIRNFLGALDCQKSHKGIIITTSDFTKSAIETTKSSTKKVVLISGEELSRLMIENNIGVSKNISYHIKKIDSDYFEED